MHNGKAEREHEPCNGDYQHGKKEVMAVQDCTYYLTGREHHSGSIIERRCMLWQRNGKTAGEEY